MINPENIVVTGEWDGEVIWREKTAAERLSEQFKKLDIREPKNLTTDNKKSFLKLVASLEASARPANYSWRKLEELLGEEADYVAEDSGNF